MPGKPMKSASMVSFDGIEIFYRSWQPPDAKHAIIMLHGAAVHSGLHYALLGRWLSKTGFSVFAPDLRGHGRSGGPRGHVNKFSDYLADLHILVQKVKAQYPGKLFLWGESLGGLICLGYAEKFPNLIDGIIASSPGLRLTAWLPFPALFNLNSFSFWAPTLYVPMCNLVEQAIGNPKMIKKARRDALLITSFTVRYLAEIIEAGNTVGKGLGTLTTPCFFQLAGADRVVDTPAVARLFASIPARQKVLKIYDGLNHCLFPEKPALILKDTIQWLTGITGD